MKIIEVDELKKTFGKITALDNVSFSVEKGEFFGLLGPNGAGKTTTINILSTIMKPDEGTVRINGFSLKDDPKKCKDSIGIVPQELALYNELTALENLVFWGGLYGISKSAATNKANGLLKLLELDERKNSRIKTFSGGMKRRINIAAAMIHDPQILFMDEPTVGVDPQSRNQIYEVLNRFLENGVTIIYTTHYMDEVEKLCSHIAIIDFGNIIANGSLDELRGIAGSDSSIVIHFIKQDDLHLDELREEFGERLVIEENKLIFSTINSIQDLPYLLQKLAQYNYSLTHIAIERASLETVFLKLTGRKLRD